ncbi:hypothetical protein S83_022399, partial [Arachis hypogaea]
YCKRAVVTLGHNRCIAKHGKEFLALDFIGLKFAFIRNGTYSQEQGRNAAAHKPGHSQSGEHSNAEAIHNFHIPSCVAIDDVIQ